MDKLNKDELFIIATNMNLSDLLNFSSSYKRIDSLLCKRNEIWNYRLDKDFKEYRDEFKNLIPLEKYKLLYSLTALKRKIKYLGTVLELYNETELYFYNGELNEIPKEIGNLVNLQIFSLNDNDIKEIPKEIGNLVNLQILSLKYNKIKKIPKEIGNMINLRFFSLSSNLISEIPKEIGNLINLERLFLYNNEIKEIPKEMENLINLQRLALANNPIKEIPKEIRNLINLEIFE